MQCRDFHEIADSYLGDELMVETNHAVNSHLEQCSECRRELAARRELRSKLRRSFINAPENRMRPEFIEHLDRQLQAGALGKRDRRLATGASRSYLFGRGRNAWLALAACLLLVVGFGSIAIRQWRLSVVSRYAIRTELAKSAVGDHENCAIRFRLAEQPIDLATAGRTYDPVYVNLTKAVFNEPVGAPPDAEFVEAHSCVYQGRRFAHIVFKYHGRIVSFLVTHTSGADDSGAAEAAAFTPEQVVTCSQSTGYQVSCFRTAHHTVFVVSDLPESDNLSLARTLAPSLYAHIARNENG